MPINKAGDGTINFTAMDRKDLFDQTGVVHAPQFAICDATDLVKQIKFDPSSQSPNTSVTIKSGAVSGDVVLTLPSSSGSLGGGNSFSTIQPPNGTSPVATSPLDVLTLTSSDGSITITGNSSTDTIDFSADGSNLTPTTVSINGAAATGALNIKAQSSGLTSQFNLESSGSANTFSIIVRDGGDIFYWNGSNILYNHVGGTQFSGVGPTSAQSIWDTQTSDSSTTLSTFIGNNGASVRNIDSTAGNFSVLAFGNVSVNTSAIVGVNDSHTGGSQTGHIEFLCKSAGTMASVAKITSGGSLALTSVGEGLQVKEGSNAKMGTATLNGSTAVVVNTTAVTANSRIFVTIQASGGTAGSPYVDTRTAGTSFSLKSTNALDTSTVAWMMVEPS